MNKPAANNELPLRSFDIYFLDPERSHETLEGHYIRVIGEGVLEVVRYKDNIAWTVRGFAPGTWADWFATLPTDEDMVRIQAIQDREKNIERMLAGHRGQQN